MTNWDALPPKEFYSNDGAHICDLNPVYDSLLKILAELSEGSHIAPLNKLIELYNMAFQRSIRDVIGPELSDDLAALTSLRNLFAHGRDFFLEFQKEIEGFATLDSNPLQKPAQRLHKAGIIKTLKITGLNRQDFNAAFYSDEALIYFYRAVEEIQDKLTSSIDFLPEAAGLPFSKLPKLES